MSSQIGTLERRVGPWHLVYPVIAFAVALAIVAAVIVGSFRGESGRDGPNTAANTPTETRGGVAYRPSVGGTLANTPSEVGVGAVATSTLEGLARANGKAELNGALGRAGHDEAPFGRSWGQPKSAQEVPYRHNLVP